MRPSLARPNFSIETLLSLCSTHLLLGSSTRIKEDSIGGDLTLPGHQREPSAGLARLILPFRDITCIACQLQHLIVPVYLVT